ncbi:hypothetical protein HYE67_008196 [Fusarium culmorum]|uniref:Enoyl reductase (ER) domain-containing protein n=1 Tax=Fusarium culmorum TaxID=5516 RepID=A0A7S8HYX5_FUSCU|nr:hypothetical protein HYE67_008196 [Fusarium culmorum]
MYKLPSTTRILVAPKKCLPAEYTVIEQPIPTITKPNEVLIKMKAVCINTGDTQFAAGQLGFLFGDRLKFPFVLGMEGSGVVVAVGSAVNNFKINDEVYGVEYEKPLFSRPPAKWCSDYVVTEAKFLHNKPEHTSFEEAASLPALTVVAYQTIRNGLQLGGRDDLVGQTVYIPAALSGTGSLMIQVAKNYFGAEKIISTVSTQKMSLVEEYLPGLVDNLYDYKTQNVVELVGRGTVDFAVSTQFSTLDDCIALLKPATGLLASIASVPKSGVMLEMMGPKIFPTWLGWILDTFQWWYTWKLRGTNIKYEFFSGNPGIIEDMTVVEGMIKQGKVKGICTIVDFDNLEDIRKACDKVYKIKGGPGKLVIRM